MKKFLFVLLITVLVNVCNAAPKARIYEQSLVIPTYGVDAADPNPRFYVDRTYQGAQGRVYPYPMWDVLTNEKQDKTYDAVYLENDYIRICVLPEIGGRIFSAVDKTNGYDFFYRQSVVKPSLIGMLGAWISGGVEWNFPHHHRSRTFMPMDYRIVENPDGSKTLWLGEFERRHRMRLLLGLTVYPDSSILELTTKIFNRTPVVNSFLYFVNPAVHVDETYQVLFPPGTQYVTQHAKNEFAQWPIADIRYGGKHYDKVDISWWKNLPKPVSFFCWNYEDDFFAGYDHGKEAGTAYVANHHIAPGKKFFTFGCADEGKMWDKMLTDEDGPYLELMAGAWSDNQPDYSWIQPCEVKVVKQYWYPMRKMEGLKYANLNGCVNLEIDGGEAKIRLNTTKEHKNALVVINANDKMYFSDRITISPDKPFGIDIKLISDIKETDLSIGLYSKDQTQLLTYRPVEYEAAGMPEPVRPPGDPAKIETIEELYLAGLRLDQFHNPKLDPYAYYNEALKRDPYDSRVNTQLGILYYKRAMYDEAAKSLERAIIRITHNYTSPKNGEAFYYLGLVRRAQEKYKQAYDAFYKATWSSAWHSPAYQCLAGLDCINGDYAKSLSHIDRSISTNSLNTKALNLRAAILRKLDREKEAFAQAEKVLQIDPLDYWAINEAKGKASLVKFVNQPGFDEQSFIELAVDYANCGMVEEAIEVFKLLDKSANPMVNYYMAYLHRNTGDSMRIRTYLNLARSSPHRYCFPFRNESIKVLKFAMEKNPDDYRAPYYLGNLLYDKQPEEAIALWEKTAVQRGAIPTAHRNLAFAYLQVKNDIPSASQQMEIAVEADKNDPRLLYELDVIYEMQGQAVDKRLALLESNKDAVYNRDDSLTRLVLLYIQSQRYDDAIKILTSHHFNKWEGGGSIHDIYVDACLLRGYARLNNGDTAAALADFQKALEYPDNLEVGKPLDDSRALRTYCFIAAAYEKTGDRDKAGQYYKKAVEGHTRQRENRYYQGLAYLKLDQKENAQEIFDDLIAEGQRDLSGGETVDFFAKFGEKQSRNRRQADAHYMIALGYLGKSEKAKAKTEFVEVLKLNKYHTWAKVLSVDLVN